MRVKGCLWAARRFGRRLHALCDPAVHFGNEIFKDGNKLVVGHQPALRRRPDRCRAPARGGWVVLPCLQSAAKPVV
jgi:hypothetical protein